MIQFETQAIILHSLDHAESDRIVTFLTQGVGKLKGMAKGARRSRKRFVHAFEANSLVELKYQDNPSYGLVWVDSCKLLDPHLELREELQRWGAAALLDELGMSLIPEKVPHEEVFLLFREGLSQLDCDKDPLNVLVLCVLRLLDQLGYLLEMASCSVCHMPAERATNWGINTAKGMMTCPRHAQPGIEHLSVDLGTLLLLREARRIPIDKMWRLRIRQEMKKPLLEELIRLASRQMGRNLKSLKLLHEI